MVKRWFQTISAISIREIGMVTKCRQFALAGMSVLLLFAVNLTGSSSIAWGTVVQTNESSLESELAYPVIATDLINAGQPTLASVVHFDFVGSQEASADNLNNGSPGISAFVPDNNGYTAATATTAIDVGGILYAEWTSTYFLNLSGAPLGYDITRMQSISGWPDQRSSQRYEALVSVVGDASFTTLGEFKFLSPVFIGTNSTRITLTDSSGVLASGVDAIKFYFLVGGFDGTEKELLYREMDVFGTPTVPPQGVPGDYNNNGIVDGADYVVWRKGTNPLPNEVTGVTPGSNTPEDYDAWRAKFGNTSGSGSGLSAGAVPEPTGAVPMFSVAVGALLLRSRRGRGV
jgi:hypothetical protein